MKSKIEIGKHCEICVYESDIEFHIFSKNCGFETSIYQCFTWNEIKEMHDFLGGHLSEKSPKEV